jgi:hypothetical protein
VLILIDHDTAIQEFKTLVADLEETGFDVEVRAGYEQSLLVFAKAPRELLGNAVYKSRQVDIPPQQYVYLTETAGLRTGYTA